MRGQSFMSKSSSGLETCRYSGGKEVMARSRSRTEERCSSSRCRVFLGQTLAKQVGILLDGVENAALAIHPALVLGAEEPVEQAVRELLRAAAGDRARPSSCSCEWSCRTTPARRQSAGTENAMSAARLGAQSPDRPTARRGRDPCSACSVISALMSGGVAVAIGISDGGIVQAAQDVDFIT